eukprot:TRINITY_DN302_c0_g1_i2.p1 TRINITY_DN302_c0_g1~~TRINITY_DN302_c0_g1_i2.p1  ORF type:complete len:713 (+),score=47.84 TRINITY_DN302_c0_g1_i2:152-2140(+)
MKPSKDKDESKEIPSNSQTITKVTEGMKISAEPPLAKEETKLLPAPATVKEPVSKTTILDNFKGAIIDPDPLYSTPKRKVYKVYYEKEKFVLKTVDILSKDLARLDSLKQEYKFYKKLGSELLHFTKGLRIKTCTLNEGEIRIEMLMEYGGKSLTNRMQKATSKEIKMWMMQSLHAFRYLEARRISHFDIKPGNMVYKDGILKIIDLGCSLEYKLKANVFEPIGEKANLVRGYTKLYASPEALKCDKLIEDWIGNSIDVYCWGLSFFQLIMKMTTKELEDLRKKYPVGNEAEYAKFLDEIGKRKELLEMDPTHAVVSAIIKCLQHDPEKRGTFANILNILSGIESEGYKTRVEEAEVYNKISSAYRVHVGDYSTALSYATKSLNISMNINGEEHPSTATSYNMVGSAYYFLGNYEAAMENNEKALNIQRKVHGEYHSNTALSYHNVAVVHDSLGNHKVALENIKKALDIRRTVLGEENPDTALSYNRIGLVHHSLGNYKDALENHKKALHIRLTVRGEEHTDTAYSYNSIGYVHLCLGNNEAALENLEKALNVRRKAFGEEHPKTAISYLNIGQYYEKQKDYAKALTCMENAYQVRKKIFGDEHKSTKDAQELLNRIKSKLYPSQDFLRIQPQFVQSIICIIVFFCGLLSCYLFRECKCGNT